MQSRTPDVVLIGGGVMSAHLGAMLKCLDPHLAIEVYEAADELARESSDGWNNAGPGHAGLCELDYTPPSAGGAVDVSQAVEIFARFEQSRQFWSYAVSRGLVSRPADFIRAVPHLSLVHGDPAIAFLRARHAALVAHPFFHAMEFTADRGILRGWVPLVVDGRGPDSIAASRVAAGTDVNFGEISRRLLAWLGAQENCRVFTGHRVTNLQRATAGWALTVRRTDSDESRRVDARFAFIGAGGATLPLLQATGLPVARGLGAFPIAGQWLVCETPAVITRHLAKVYGPPPPKSGALGGPHLDVRHLQGRRMLLFGPFATWTTKFLQRAGHVTGLARAISPDNLATLLRAGVHNRVLFRFLVQQALQGPEARIRPPLRANRRGCSSCARPSRTDCINRSRSVRQTVSHSTSASMGRCSAWPRLSAPPKQSSINDSLIPLARSPTKHGRMSPEPGHIQPVGCIRNRLGCVKRGVTSSMSDSSA
jgi:malate dehydrogenase (quinone)